MSVLISIHNSFIIEKQQPQQAVQLIPVVRKALSAASSSHKHTQRNVSLSREASENEIPFGDRIVLVRFQPPSPQIWTITASV